MFVQPGSIAPRRCQLDQLSKVESQLIEAMSEVETLGASSDLTSISIIIEDARARIAEIIDGRLHTQLGQLGSEKFLEHYGTLDSSAMARLMSDIG